MQPDPVRDPVCGMEFRTSQAAAVVLLDGEVFYFCCEYCKAEFEREPLRFASSRKATEEVP